MTSENVNPEGNGEEGVEQATICYNKFLVDERPYCMWDWNTPEKNRHYIETIKGDYFDHVVDVNEPLLEGDQAHHAAITLRSAYAFAVETLLAHVCGTLQAPDCIVGWILKYNNKDLENLVRKITEGKPIKTVLTIDPITWETLPNLFAPIDSGDREYDERIRRHFGKLWSKLAKEYLDDLNKTEFNSYKHAFRLHPHGFSVLMGAQEAPGVPAAATHRVINGKHGSSFYEPLPVGINPATKKPDAHNFRLKHQMLNWSPYKYVKLLRLLAMSIDNVANVMRNVNRIPSPPLQYAVPFDEALFDEAWSFWNHEAQSSIVSVHEEAAKFIPLETRESILASPSYRTANAGGTKAGGGAQ